MSEDLGPPTGLAAEDVAFLRRVSAAVFHNPFSKARHAIDVELAQADGSESREGLLEKLTTRVGDRLRVLADGGPLRVDRWRGESRRLLEHAVLFLAFHRFADPFDDHIRAQERAGSELCDVGFGDDVLRHLVEHGFRKEVAVRMLAVFFQMRRAFYFIDRGLTGRAPSMRALRERLWNNVCTADIGRYESRLVERMEDFSTILLGPTGSGKGAAAAAIGRSGFIPYDAKRRRFVESFTEAFVSINLSSYPATLIESELFGHRKGAFTGAIERHEGVFSRCSGHGSVFLDEIGEVSIPVQIKLLRVLQERCFSPVGSHEVVRFRGRVVAATNQDLDRMRAEGSFRDDFYYRLCSDVIEMPPLRRRLAEHPGELELLLESLLARIAPPTDAALVEEIAAGLRKHLRADHAWPGNVRELEQATRRLLIGHPYTGDGAALGADPRAVLVEGLDTGGLTAQQLVSAYCKLLYARHGTYEEVARRTELDRRTVKKHVLAEA